MVKNAPASAGDTASSPGPGRSHMPRSNQTHVPQLLSLRSRAHEPKLLSPSTTTTEACVPRAHALQQEKPPNEKPTNRNEPLLAATREKSPRAAIKTQDSQK